MPFALLCALAATSWMLAERVSGMRFSLWGDALACLCGAGVCAVAEGRRARRQRSAWVGAAGGMMVVVGPALPSLAGMGVDGGGLSIALALTAVVVAVAGPAIAGSEFAPRVLWPGLAAAAALLIAVPMPGVGDWRSDVVMVAAPVMTGVGAVLFRRSTGSMGWKMAGGLAMAAAVFAADALVRRSAWGVSFAGVTLDAVLFGLSLLTLAKMSATQYAARYAVVPLLLLVEGLVLVSRELLNVRTALCAAMLLAASVAMLRSGDEENVV